MNLLLGEKKPFQIFLYYGFVIHKLKKKLSNTLNKIYIFVQICLLCVERRMDQGICQNGLQTSRQTFSTLPTAKKKKKKETKVCSIINIGIQWYDCVIYGIYSSGI